ncbi:MAG: hypothetical protein DMG59_14075 [Acidobacteria bacterium]|nr:MAG: hypothetical protein DMG59_14075 [Acidobacteriota bacterium]
MPTSHDCDDVAEACVKAQTGLRRAGAALHDDVGPLLSAAGLRLQLLAMDFPKATERVREVLDVLNDAMERVRALSQVLNPSPVYRVGFKTALADLVEKHRPSVAGGITFRFDASAQIPVEAAAAIYEAAVVALVDAVERAGATRVDVSVSGSNSLTLRVKDNGARRRSRRTMAAAALLARHAGFALAVSTGKSTIVSIRYALRRSSRG